MGDNSSTTFNDFDVDGCNIYEIIWFLQKLALSPNASSMNAAFTKHITNALMQIREEKLKQKVSIPKKLEDGWEPIINMNVNDFDCHALCHLGASIFIMPRKIYDMLGLPPLENCYFDVTVTTQDFIKFWGIFFAFVMLEMIEFSQGFKTFESI
jgi:hypothetical protein